MGGGRCSVKILSSGGGNICPQLVQQHMPSLWSTLQTGLSWEILSHRMLQEEPEACYTIQAASNIKGGLQMQEHEMQAISRISRICMEEVRLIGKLIMNNVRRKLAVSMAALSAHDEFDGVVSFVVDLGADTAGSGFIDDLRIFHSTFVSAKTRRLRFGTFAIATELGEEFPHLKVGLIKYSYSACAGEREDPTDPFISILTLAEVKKIKKDTDAIKLVESVMRFFRLLFLKSEERKAASKFLGQLDIAFVRILLNKTGAMPEPYKNLKTIEEVAQHALDVVGKNIVPMSRVLELGRPWKAPAPSAPEDQSLLPKVLEFKGGIAQTSQDIRTPVDAQEEEIPWTAGVLKGLTTLAPTKGVLSYAIPLLSSVAMELTDDTNVKVCILDKKVFVRAGRDFAKGELVLAPSVANLTNFSTKSSHPHALQVVTSDMQEEIFLVPTLRLPVKGEAPGSSARQPFVPPFWCIRRSKSTAETNCEVVMVPVQSQSVINLGTAPLNIASAVRQFGFTVTLPVMTNKQHITKGAELIVAAKDKPPPSKRSPADMNWRSANAKKNKTK